MSYEDLLKNKMPNVPASAPKEEQRIDELSVPNKKQGSSYEELKDKLSPQDQSMLEMLKDYDKVKKVGAKSKELKDEIDLQSTQILSRKRPDEMAALKVKSHLATLPKKV